MRTFFTILTILMLAGVLRAQPVPQTVIAEHFTNTYCSICASRNPGFYANLSQYPQVLHIAYHPSSPYAACPLNQHNKAENDARTNFYGLYGSTPRIMIQGKEVSSFNSAAIFQNELGKTTAFEVIVKLTEISSTILEARVVVRKKDASALTNITIYTVLVEDTLIYAANNGEGKHYDVFRKSFTGAQPMMVAAPANIGDSLVQTQQVTINTAWDKGNIYAITIVQDGSKNAVQAAKSNHLNYATAIHEVNNEMPLIYPNPASDFLQLQGNAGKLFDASIIDITGRVLRTFTLSGNDKIDVAALNKGMYILQLKTNDMPQHIRFIKN